jgi:ketosteroid isomerase-like protein
MNRFAIPGRTLLIASAFMATIGAVPAETAAREPRIEMQQSAAAADNKAIVIAAFDRWRAGGNVFTGLLAPDVVWTIHGSGPVAGTYRSLQDFIDRASAPLVSRLAGPIVPEVHDVLADGDTVVIRFEGAATTTSGAPYRNQFVWIFRLREGLVVEAEAFLDLMAYQQVVENNAPRVR